MLLFRKLFRYAAVSLLSTAVSLTILSALIITSAMTAGWANVVATAVGTVPSFELNRRWVWNKRGDRSMLTELGPFCALSFASLAMSTLAVSVAASWAASAGFAVMTRTLVAVGANIGTFGSLWVFQYVLLDRVLFRSPSALAPMISDRSEINGAGRISALS